MSAAEASRDVLVITDGGPAAVNAVWRAALIAREHGAALRLLHAHSGRNAAAPPHRSLEAITGSVRARLGIDAEAQIVEGELLQRVIKAARSAGLLVIGTRRTNPIRQWISGTQAEQLIRLCRIPTLVIKRPAVPGRNAVLASGFEPGRYGRVLVPVDLRDESVNQVACAMAFSRDPRTQVFHAVGPGAGPREPGSRLRTRAHTTTMELAHSALAQIVKASGAHERGAVAAIGFGAPVDCVLARERATGAELVVIGKRRRGLLADFFMGGVTQKVLARSHADVLVMPHIGTERCAT
jgi:nucleotide-binding universal stress UspA family protein